MHSVRVGLAAAFAALVVLRLVVALAPAEPRLFGIPFGLLLELAVMGVSTVNLWFAVRALLPVPPESRAAGEQLPSPNRLR